MSNQKYTIYVPKVIADWNSGSKKRTTFPMGSANESDDGVINCILNSIPTGEWFGMAQLVPKDQDGSGPLCLSSDEVDRFIILAPKWNQDWNTDQKTMKWYPIGYARESENGRINCMINTIPVGVWDGTFRLRVSDDREKS